MKFDAMMDASDYEREELKKDSTTFQKSTENVYDDAFAPPSGSDRWNYFNETIIPNILPENGAVVNLTTDNLQLVKKNKNVVVLFTDGYIENINRTRVTSIITLHYFFAFVADTPVSIFHNILF